MRKFIFPSSKIIPLICAVLLCAGLGVRLWYLAQTDYHTRSHDVHGHVDYIKYVANNWRVPHIDECWQCYQPPLYYFLTGAIYAPLRAEGLSEVQIFTALQFVSVIFSMVFLLCSYAIILHTKLNGLFKVLALLLVTFWPTTIIHGVRVSNDMLLYPLMAAAIFCIQRWWTSNHDLWLYAAAGATFLSMLTKTNALVLAVIMVALIVVKFWTHRPRRWRFIHLGLDIVFIVIISGLLTLGPRMGQLNNRDWLVSNIGGLDAGLVVPNNVANYVYFDTAAFINVPFIDPWDTTTGRNFAWNYLGKTSVFGEFKFTSELHIQLAQIISVLLIVMAAFVVLTLLISSKFWAEHSLHVFLGAAFVAASMLYRVRSPFSTSSDFRFIFPVLPVLIVLFVLAVQGCRNRNLRILGVGTAVVMVAAQVLFMLAPMPV